MARDTIKRALVCPECGRKGEFVYERISGNSKGTRINYESLTPGFRFKDTGYAPTSRLAAASAMKSRSLTRRANVGVSM